MKIRNPRNNFGNFLGFYITLSGSWACWGRVSALVARVWDINKNQATLQHSKTLFFKIKTIPKGSLKDCLKGSIKDCLKGSLKGIYKGSTRELGNIPQVNLGSLI